MIQRREHRGKTIYEVAEFSGKNREINICQASHCKKFKPGDDDHCQYAMRSFALSLDIGIAPVMACQFCEPDNEVTLGR